MAGRGPAPKPGRRRANDPARGDWQPAPGVGWQHGKVPTPPPRLLKVSRDTWATWFAAWFAAFWEPEDLPGLEVVIVLYDQFRRGAHQRANELRLQMDNYGITKKGQQDRRWSPPSGEAKPGEPGKVLKGRWTDLKVVDG